MGSRRQERILEKGALRYVLSKLVISPFFLLAPPKIQDFKMSHKSLPMLKQTCLDSKQRSSYLLGLVVYRKAGGLQVASLQHVASTLSWGLLLPI